MNKLYAWCNLCPLFNVDKKAPLKHCISLGSKVGRCCGKVVIDERTKK